jgi:hypothetical protein
VREVRYETMALEPLVTSHKNTENSEETLQYVPELYDKCYCGVL